MSHNSSDLGRKLRMSVGVILIIWGIIAQNWLGAIGLIPLIFGFFKFCPICSITKSSSKKKC
ncbi:MAG: DUF2892 domain-containing protein [Campylobacteraceae bacterium]|nr:DUF2892 domain-containing protein [Campylobacteraceae bacterium]